MKRRMKKVPGFPQEPNDKNMGMFFEDHKVRVRKFAQKYPSHMYVEVDIDNPRAGQTLAMALGLDAKCWKHLNNNKKSNPRKSDVDVR